MELSKQQESITIQVPENIISLVEQRNIARDYQAIRHLDWDENYELYRNRVRTNRLTQRQAVNIPLMKETIRTLLSKIDDPPIIDWKEMSGDEMKEMVFQEIWNEDFERLNMEGIDIQDKKTVMLYGRSFRKLNWGPEGFDVTALDIYDVVIDPLVNPLDIETARYLVHQNIFRSLNDILNDDRYTAEGKRKLKIWADSDQGIIQSGQNMEEWKNKNERLKSMGVPSDDIERFHAGDVIINLTEQYVNEWNDTEKGFEKRVYVYADDMTELSDDKLVDLIGVDFYPFITWGDDIETNDFWSDGPADLVRTPNKVVNVWFSQLVENRTIRNFQMHWYDATQSNYTPQTYEPGPGRMLPAPGDPNKTVMPVNISGLDETLTAIEFVTSVIERGSSATAIEKGTGLQKQATLGEVKTLVGKATERTIMIAKFYRRAQKEFAYKWERMVNANQDGKVKVSKTSRTGRIYPKTVYPIDWKSEAGYKAMVRSNSEQEEENTKGIQKMQFVLQQFPNNPALVRIAQRRMLEILDLTPEELREVEQAEKQAKMSREKAAEKEMQPVVPKTEPNEPQGGEEQALGQQITRSLAELGQA